MIRAASVTVELDLRNYSRFLQSQGIPHQITEESGQQIIWVGLAAHEEVVRRTLADFPFDEVNSSNSSEIFSRSSGFVIKKIVNKLLAAFLRSPITASLVMSCILVAILSGLGSNPSRVGWLFFPLVSTDSTLSLLRDLVGFENALRSLTPMFLHFGELHLVFNMLWLWYFGRQLEPIHPVWLYSLIIIVTSLVSNASQYLYNDYNNFGGMSGVVYGLLGYTWVVHKLMPRSHLELSNSVFVFFVITLVAMELLASSWIASAAHLGGLFSGLVLGVGSVVYYRFILNRQSISR